jgi:hypothetical protein
MYGNMTGVRRPEGPGKLTINAYSRGFNHEYRTIVAGKRVE